jgi:preprotein translocase subunit SecE
MSRERENHIVPALVAVIGVVAFGVLVYLFLYGADWLLNRLLSSSAGKPI